ncbi:hypothetical protein GGR50DRAFT_362010 [Xylaria sp. CBS 124048]|nr:hypothetical protein GGR50DRAFT_362010 [Xylaria sp. CBS 124048]
MAQSPSFFSRSPSFSFSLSPSFLSPSAWRKRFRMGCPPVIPPRFSSLRHTFIFRTPTIQSLKQAFRIPSLASSGTIHTSGASNRTAGHRTDFTSDDSFNMLPLYQDSRRAAETLRSPSDAYCTQGRDTGMQSGRMSRLGNHRTQVRIPIVRQPVRQPVRQSFSAGTNDADYADEADDSIISQDITLGSFFTNDSDIHMNPSWAYTVQGEVGIAR